MDQSQRTSGSTTWVRAGSDIIEPFCGGGVDEGVDEPQGSFALGQTEVVEKGENPRDRLITLMVSPFDEIVHHIDTHGGAGAGPSNGSGSTTNDYLEPTSLGCKVWVRASGLAEGTTR